MNVDLRSQIARHVRVSNACLGLSIGSLLCCLLTACAPQAAAPKSSAASSNSAYSNRVESSVADHASAEPKFGSPQRTAIQTQAQASIAGGMNWSGPGRSEIRRSDAPALDAPALDASTQEGLASDERESGSAPTIALPIKDGADAGRGDRLAAELGNRVEVFYATDRLPTAALIPSTWRTFAPVAAVWMIGAALCIGFTLARRFNTFWLVGCGLAICLGLTVLHARIIRWQQYSRLAHNAETRFSSARDNLTRDYPLHLGSARVTLPSTHRPGRFEQPQLFRFEFVESTDKHIVLHSLKEQTSSTAWFDELSEVAKSGQRSEAFVFIHGYNVRFIDALKRTAQLSHDLELQGPAVCYSWPSRGDVAAYSADEASVSWSAPHFEQLLLDLRMRTGCERINVIAHSMGNRALLEAIERIEAKELGRTKLIDSLVMAAPDVDLGEFSTRYLKPLQKVAQHTTLYFSDSDRALLLSARLHGAPRLGLLRDHLQAFSGIESVYVGTQTGLGLGHSYYGDDPAVIEDLKTLLHHGTSAASRELLRSATNASGVSFWQLERSLQAQRATLPAR